MSDNAADPQATTQADPHGAAPAEDWEAKYREALEQSRKWEARSKANSDKAKAYDDAKKAAEDGGAAAAEALERAERAEAELARLKAAQERSTLVAEVAEAKGVDHALLSLVRGDTREELEAAADAIAKAVGGAPIYPGVPDPSGGAGAKAGAEDVESIKDPVKRVEARAMAYSLGRK